MSLGNRVVAVTGAFGQLGQAVARAALARGAQVGLIGHGAAPADVAAALPECVVVAGVDLSVAADAKRAIDEIASAFGRLDVLVNVAGGFRWEKFSGGDVATWDAMFELNVKTAVCASAAALPHLRARGGGRIVNVGAFAASRGTTGMGPYSAAKSALARFTESLADELAGDAITVNAVLPSILDTPANRAAMPNVDASRWVPPADVADVILFLASDEARAVTGALIPVTRGG